MPNLKQRLNQPMVSVLILNKINKNRYEYYQQIEKILFLFNFSLKKIYPSKTLIIGIIKYPKLASIILSVATSINPNSPIYKN